MTIAVVLNKVLTETETQDIKDLVASARRSALYRGDAVTVSGLQFSPELAEQKKESMDLLQQSNWIELGISLVKTLDVRLRRWQHLFILYRLLNRPLEGQLVHDEPQYESFFEEAEPLLAASNLPALEARLDPEIEHMRESINSLVNKDPVDAARVLLTYMQDIVI